LRIDEETLDENKTYKGSENEKVSVSVKHWYGIRTGINSRNGNAYVPNLLQYS
jgi:hypothetical protein